LANLLNQSLEQMNNFFKQHYLNAFACAIVVVLLRSFAKWRNGPKIKAYDIDGVPIKELKTPNYSRSAIIFHSEHISKQGERLAQDEPYVLKNGKYSEVVIHTPEHVREFLRQDLNVSSDNARALSTTNHGEQFAGTLIQPIPTPPA